MGLGDTVRRFLGRPSQSDLEASIAWEAAARQYGWQDFLGIPAVHRGRQLLVSVLAQLEPVAWADGYPMEDQPAVLRRPQPELTRQQWLWQLATSLVDHGNALLFQPISGRNATGYPDVSVVIPWDTVEVEWVDESHLFRRYRFGGRTFYPGDVIHVAIDRAAGELSGHSPMDRVADALARVLAADLYAGDWFENGAVPSITLKFDGTLTDEQSAAAKRKWIADHRDHSPAVLPRGWDLKDSAGYSPQTSQLLETRGWGVQEVARALGIFPAELLLAEINGSSLTYQNISEALMSLVKVTLQPVYMATLEEALSDLLPRTQAVRFNTSELERLGTQGRFTAYQTGVTAGFLTNDQIDRWEGWNRATPPPVPPPLQPTPPAPEPAMAGGTPYA